MPAARNAATWPLLDPCPDAETLAEFLDGRMKPPEDEAVVTHLMLCDLCCTVFLDAAETAHALVPRRRSPTGVH